MTQQYLQPSAKTPHLIESTTDLQNVGILLLQQHTLDIIKEKSGPLTETNEYQVHYWALICRIHQTDKSVVDICLPTVFFNYTQHVAHARIDFEFQDVCDMSEKIEPVHNIMVNKYMASSFITTLKEHYDIEFISVNSNSIHKHP